MRFRLFGFALLLALGCKDPYTPKVISGNRNYLVVDGFINAGANTTTRIRLTRTTNVNDTASVAAEHGANISITQGNSSYILTETGDSGYYETSAMQLATSANCQLHIQTTDQEQYESDDIPVLTAPLIDSVYYAPKDGGMQIFLNGHDPSNTVQYYRWDYTETWAYHPPYTSSVLFDWSKRMLSMRSQGNIDSLHNCYESDQSTDILVYSAQALSQSQVSTFPIAYIPPASIKLSDTYAIDVRQYALNNAAYNYFVTLKKVTEDLGDVFGPLPSQLKGNIHAVKNPDAVVIGYMTASTVREKMIFIYNYNLTWGYSFDTRKYPTQLVGAAGLDVPLDDDTKYFLLTSSPCPDNPPPVVPCSAPHGACCSRAIPINFFQQQQTLQYCYDTICIDCIFWGKGGRKKPDFWPN